MKLHIYPTAEALGLAAAQRTAEYLNAAIATKGEARLILSTGASQFTTLTALIQQPVDWSRVVMFHLDEYLGVDETHPASFVGYLKERFVSKVPLKAVHFVDPTPGAAKAIETLTEAIRASKIDVGLIGIGENGHLAFNDPPADFTTTAAYHVVTLDTACRNQQIGEGWFASLDEVPTHAISMTVHQILQCEHIISAVPYRVKASAIQAMMTSPGLDPMIPASALKFHPHVDVFLDTDSSSLLKEE